MEQDFSIAAFNSAARRIKPYIRRTALSELEAGLFIKAEHRQTTGSFKLRGALNKVLSLDPKTKPSLVCASAGNHGLGVARACAIRHYPCVVVVPREAANTKVQRIRAEGATVEFADGDYGLAERQAMERADTTSGACWVSPYNDRQVILGQGTVGLEIASQLERLGDQAFDLFVPASGGGLVCGVGLALKRMGKPCRVIAVQAKAAPYLYAYFHQGSWAGVHETPTLADGLAGPVESNSLTLELLPEACDDVQVVSEAAIEKAMERLLGLGELVEPSAAVAYAAAQAGGNSDRAKVVLLTGSNVDKAVLEGIGFGASQ